MENHISRKPMSLRIETQEESNALELLNKFKYDISMIDYSELSEKEKKEKASALLNKFSTNLLKFFAREDSKYHKMFSEALKYMSDNTTNKKEIEIGKFREETKDKIDPTLRIELRQKPPTLKKRPQKGKSSIKKMEKLLSDLYSNPHLGKW